METSKKNILCFLFTLVFLDFILLFVVGLELLIVVLLSEIAIVIVVFFIIILIS